MLVHSKWAVSAISCQSWILRILCIAFFTFSWTVDWVVNASKIRRSQVQSPVAPVWENYDYILFLGYHLCRHCTAFNQENALADSIRSKEKYCWSPRSRRHHCFLASKFLDRHILSGNYRLVNTSLLFLRPLKSKLGK